MYNRGSTCVNVKNAQKDLFVKNGRMNEIIPPTADAVALYVKQLIHQGRFVWGQMLEPNQILPTPADWGWQRTANSTWEPVWTALPPASESMS